VGRLRRLTVSRVLRTAATRGGITSPLVLLRCRAAPPPDDTGIRPPGRSGHLAGAIGTGGGPAGSDLRPTPSGHPTPRPAPRPDPQGRHRRGRAPPIGRAAPHRPTATPSCSVNSTASPPSAGGPTSPSRCCPTPPASHRSVQAHSPCWNPGPPAPPNVVYLEKPNRIFFVDAAPEVDRYARDFELLTQIALPQDESAEFIHTIANQLRNNTTSGAL